MKSTTQRIAVIRAALTEEAATLREGGNIAASDAICAYLTEAASESLLRFHSLVQTYGHVISDPES